MHLLRAETVTLDQSAEAVDLGLSPATRGWLLGALGVLVFAMTIPMTNKVASPRFMRLAKRRTAGSIAIEANQAINNVKMTEPPSSIRNFANNATATTPRTTNPICQTFRGSSLMVVLSWVFGSSLIGKTLYRVPA